MFKLADGVLFNKSDHMESFFSKKETDAIFYSVEGVKFDVHRDVLGQTDFLRNILSCSKNCGCNTIEVFCPFSKYDLECMIKFLYSGKLSCDTEKNALRVLDYLRDVFGFPKEGFLNGKDTAVNNLCDIELKTANEAEILPDTKNTG